MRCFKACIAAALLLATPLAAEEAFVAPCGPDLPGHAQSIPEPWEANTATFANGDVRIIILDTIEPAGGAFHLMVLTPPRAELGERQCRIVSRGPNWQGFGFLSLERMEASYDPATGLRVVMDMGLYNPASGTNDALSLAVNINQASGRVIGVW